MTRSVMFEFVLHRRKSLRSQDWGTFNSHLVPRQYSRIGPSGRNRNVLEEVLSHGLSGEVSFCLWLGRTRCG